jgi:hypothetical protein
MSLSKFTDLVFLLDRSSSMGKLAHATRSSFNEFLESQKQLVGEARLTLVQFSRPDDFVYSYLNTPLRAVEGLTTTNYFPRGGSTALRDALGRLIDETGARYAQLQESNRPENVVFVILTDGEENNSQRFSVDDIRGRITRQQDVYKWQFVYLGANQDAILVAQELAMPMASAMTYNYTEAGIYNTSKSLGEKISLLRTSVPGSYNVTFNAADRTNAMETDKK